MKGIIIENPFEQSNFKKINAYNSDLLEGVYARVSLAIESNSEFCTASYIVPLNSNKFRIMEFTNDIVQRVCNAFKKDSNEVYLKMYSKSNEVDITLDIYEVQDFVIGVELVS